METTTKFKFRRTELVNESTQVIVSESIWKEFLSLDQSEFWSYDTKRQELINAALDLGLTGVADEMISST